MLSVSEKRQLEESSPGWQILPTFLSIGIAGTPGVLIRMLPGGMIHTVNPTGIGGAAGPTYQPKSMKVWSGGETREGCSLVVANNWADCTLL